MVFPCYLAAATKDAGVKQQKKPSFFDVLLYGDPRANTKKQPNVSTNVPVQGLPEPDTLLLRTCFAPFKSL